MWPSYKPNKLVEIKSFHSAFEFEFKKGHVFSGEAHDFWEFFYVIKGQISISADERMFNLSENEIIFHKPMEFHKFTVESETALIFVMTFSIDGEYGERLKNAVLHLNPRQKKRLFEIIELLREASEKITSFKGFSEVFSQTPDFSQLLCCHTEIFLLSLTGNENMVISENETDEAIIYRNAIRTMENHINEWINVPQIACQCNTSVSTLKKLFSRFLGMGIHKFFLKMKINHAILMLKSGKSVSETANELGFSSQNYFSMVFKRETGVSPTYYKKQQAAAPLQNR